MKKIFLLSLFVLITFTGIFGQNTHKGNPTYAWSELQLHYSIFDAQLEADRNLIINDSIRVYGNLTLSTSGLATAANQTAGNSAITVYANQYATRQQLDSVKLYLKQLNDSVYASVKLNWVRISKGMYDTLSTRVDTVSRLIAGDTTNSFNVLGFKNWWEGDIMPDDTIEVSASPNFPRGSTMKIVPTGARILLPRRDLTYFLNLYVRRFVTTGATGTVNYDVRIWGQ